MRVQFQKISNDRHRLTVIRRDGTTETAELESKSLLMHDFLHLAIESEAGLKKSFWGQVASGRSFMELAGKMESPGMPLELDEIAATEMIVGASSRFGRDDPTDLEAFVTQLRSFFEQSGKVPPMYLSVDFFTRMLERFRAIRGHWNGTPFGEVMEVEWREED